jgi:hypothetical protein
VRGAVAILQALGSAVRRDLGSFRSLQVNNFFLFVLLLIYGALVSGVRPASSYPFLLLLGLLLLFPLSSDPLAKIPASRFALWPLSRGQTIALRAVSVVLSPVLWFALFIAWRVQPSLLLAFIALAIGSQVLGRVSVSSGGWRWMPEFPGPLGAFVTKDLRQMFSVLDTYVAVLIALGGVAYRLLAAHPDPAAFPIFAMLVALALSTYAQCSFALDGPSGLTRYGLLPLTGMQVLRSKDNAFFLLLAVLTAPLNLASGLAFGFAAVAIGRYPALRSRLPVVRRRFTGGRFVFGAAQMVVGAALGFAADRHGPAYLLGSAVLYAASLYFARNVRNL